MAGVKIVDLPSLGRDLISTDLLELSLVGGSGSRKITGQEIMNASKLNVGATPIINGTAGRILFQGAGDVLGESANLFWDNTNGRLGIGTSSPSRTLDIAGNQLITYADVANPDVGPAAFQIVNGTFLKFSVVYNATGCRVNMFGTATQGLQINTGSSNNITSIGGGGLTLSATSNNFTISGNAFLLNTAGSERMRIPNTGNVLINTTTDAGYKLDVNGTARVQGKLNVSTGGLDLTGTLTNFSGYQGYGQMQLFSGSAFQMFNSANNSKISLQYTTATGLSLSINPENLSGVNTGLALGASLVASANNQTLVGLDINPTFNTGAFTGVETLALRVTGFISNFTSSGATQLRIIGPSGSNKSLFFFNSSTTFASTRIYNAGTTNHLVFATGDSLSNPTDRLTIFASTGNIGINTTTDAGYKLDVNGTARVQSNLTVGNATSGVRYDINFNVSFPGGGTRGGIVWSSGASILNRRKYNGGNDNTLSFLVGNSTVELLTIQEHNGTVNTQNVGINNTNPDVSAILDVVSTTKGFLPPRMTNAQRAAIASPAVGLIVYCTDSTEGLYVYKSTGWTFMV